MKKITVKYVCSWCKSHIRTDEKEMPDDLAHLDTSHDICQKCFDRHYRSRSPSGSSSSSDRSTTSP